MMKPMDDNSNNGNNNNNNNSNDSNGTSSWLGFSLSPQMKMEVASSQYHHETQQQQQHLNNSSSSALCFPGGSVSSGFQTPSSHHLTVMPIKSDGSLCIMEALSRSQSQGMVPSSPPKLENFLGGASLGAHNNSNHYERDQTMPLSLDSIYYQQNEAYYSANGGLFQAQMVEGLTQSLIYF